MLTWEELAAEMKPDLVGGRYIAYYKGKHYDIGFLNEGVSVMSDDGAEWATKLASPELEVVPVPKQVENAAIGIVSLVDGVSPVVRRKQRQL